VKPGVIGSCKLDFNLCKKVPGNSYKMAKDYKFKEKFEDGKIMISFSVNIE
jgi:hypothetical protein